MTPLIADQFFNDPDVIKAKELLINALTKHQSNITKVVPPKQQLVSYYDKSIQELSQIRGRKLFFPYVGSGIGNGPFVELADGSIKYDLSVA